MNEKESGIVTMSAKTHDEAVELVNRLFEAAQPSAVFAEPVTVGDITVITASEVHVALGYGFGMGYGGDIEAADADEADAEAEEAGEEAGVEASEGFGGGGGGGGASGSRPVAVISIGPEGVRVEPVVDVTKVALALFTTLGAMAFALGRMKSASRKL